MRDVTVLRMNKATAVHRGAGSCDYSGKEGWE